LATPACERHFTTIKIHRHCEEGVDTCMICLANHVPVQVRNLHRDEEIASGCRPRNDMGYLPYGYQ